MTIEKLDEFASNGDKHLTGLDVATGFPRADKPERPWFNKLFGDITGKINEVVDSIDGLPPFEGGVLADTFVTVTANGDYPATNLRAVVSDVRASSIATMDKVDLSTMAEIPNYVGSILALKQGVYSTGLFGRAENTHIFGAGSTVNVNPSNPVSVRIGNNSTIDGITFKCLNPDLENSRAALEVVSGSTYSNCSFQGFRDPTIINAWGLYVAHAYNNIIKNCTFADNTTYDLTIVDNVDGLLIDNVRGLGDAGCELVIEPNVALENKLSVDNVIIKNSKLSSFINMHAADSVSMSRVILENCDITNLKLWGGYVDIKDSKVGVVTQADRYMTALKWDSLLVGKNELIDVNPIEGGNDDGAVLVDIDGVKAWKFDTNPVNNAGTRARLFRKALDAGTYVITLDLMDVTHSSKQVTTGVSMMVASGNFTGTELPILSQLGLGRSTAGQTNRGRRSYIYNHTGGDIRVLIGILEYGITTVGYLKGVSVNKVVSYNHDHGNFNDLELAPAKVVTTPDNTVGGTAFRPTNPSTGQTYYDLDLGGKLIIWNGTAWADSMGVVV